MHDKEKNASAEHASVIDVRQVIATINRARAAYGATRIEELPSGLRLNPSHCPLARAFRMGVADRLFFGVGSGWLRVETVNEDPGRIAYAIKSAWYDPPRVVEGEPVSSIIRLPPELRAFVREFDEGALPEYVGKPDENESACVAAMARKITDAKARIQRGARSLLQLSTSSRVPQNSDRPKAAGQKGAGKP
jgi:hypothetical protein